MAFNLSHPSYNLNSQQETQDQSGHCFLTQESMLQLSHCLHQQDWEYFAVISFGAQLQEKHANLYNQVPHNILLWMMM